MYAGVVDMNTLTCTARVVILTGRQQLKAYWNNLDTL